MTRKPAGLLILSTLLLTLVATPALAADELGVSWDGRHWSGQLRGSLFDPSLRWVPGDVRSNSFHVRNQADDAGILTVSVDITDRDRLLRNGEVSLAARVGGRGWIPMQQVGEEFRLSETTLPGSASDEVTVRARFDPASTNRSRADHLALQFRVTLTDAGADPGDDPENDPNDEGPGAHDDPDENGLLPGTGAPDVGWLVVLAGIAVGVGAGLMRSRRREEAGHGTPR